MPHGEPKRYLHTGLHPGRAKLSDNVRQRYLPHPTLHPKRARLPDNVGQCYLPHPDLYSDRAKLPADRVGPYLCRAALPDDQ